MSKNSQFKISDFIGVDNINRFQDALAIAREKGDKHSEAENLGNLGWVYCWHTENSVDRAIEFHQQAIAIAREIGAKGLEAENLEGLGYCYGLSLHDKGDYQQATAFFDAALTIAREVGDREREGDCLHHLGVMQERQHNIEQAQALYEQSLVISREIGDKRGEASILSDIGDTKRSLGDLRAAVHYYEQSITAYQSTENVIDEKRWSEVHNYGRIASIYLQLEDSREALNFFNQGLELARKTGYEKLYLSFFRQVKKRLDEFSQSSDSD